MKKVEIRYSKIFEKFPREFILLQGSGCFWKKCKFCDYFEDVSEDPFELNSKVIEKITGEFGILDVINSGSAMELDDKTLDLIYKKCLEKNIKELWFEVHWAYRNKLEKFAERFKGIKVKFRTGIETFNGELRSSWNKGIPEDVTAEDVSKYFSSVCLLVGVKGQKFETIKSDIELAKKYFERFTVSVFVKNSTRISPDPVLIGKFIKEIYPKIKNDRQIDILISNTDLGVG